QRTYVLPSSTRSGSQHLAREVRNSQVGPRQLDGLREHRQTGRERRHEDLTLTVGHSGARLLPSAEGLGSCVLCPFRAQPHGPFTPCERFAASVAAGLAHHSVPAGCRPWPGRLGYLRRSISRFLIDYVQVTSSFVLLDRASWRTKFSDSTSTSSSPDDDGKHFRIDLSWRFGE